MITIRSAMPDDLAVVERLLGDAALPVTGVAEAFASFLIADDGGACIGAIGLERHGGDALLRSLVVDRSRRGRGVGQTLCKALLARARDGGVQHVYLLTETAEGFFSRLGFVTIPREQAPTAIRATGEFAVLCSSSAALMITTLG